MGVAGGSEYPEAVELTYTISREDFWEFHRLGYKRKRTGRFNVLLFAMVAVGTCLLLLATNPSFGLLPLLAGIGVFVVLFVVCKLLLKRRVMRVPMEDGAALGERYIRIGPDGVFGRGKHSEGICRWSMIKEVTETKDHIFMFMDTHMAFIIPRRAFARPGDADAFVNLVESFRKNSST